MIVIGLAVSEPQWWDGEIEKGEHMRAWFWRSMRRLDFLLWISAVLGIAAVYAELSHRGYV
jgi:hypothetical protein